MARGRDGRDVGGGGPPNGPRGDVRGRPVVSDPDPPGPPADGHGVERRGPVPARRVEETVRIAVPVRTVYNQATQFLALPRFVRGVRRVEQHGPTVVAWTLGRGPVRRRVAVEIVEQDPDAGLAWRELHQRPRHRGEAVFRPDGRGGTRLTVRLVFAPRGAGALPGVTRLVSRLVRRELEDFKTGLEALGQESGAWRGTVRNGRVQHDRPEPPRSRVAHWPVG